MGKTILTTLVGGILLFSWQSLSWTMFNIHESQASYTPEQDRLLRAIENVKIPEGEYALPTFKPDASVDERNAYMEKYVGKPWAVLRYKKELKNTMPLNMVRSVVINILIVFFLCLFIGMIRQQSFMNIFLVCLGFGLLSYLTNSYLYSVWFGNDTIPDLIDAGVQFSILGLWLGFMYGRKS